MVVEGVVEGILGPWACILAFDIVRVADTTLAMSMEREYV